MTPQKLVLLGVRVRHGLAIREVAGAHVQVREFLEGLSREQVTLGVGRLARSIEAAVFPGQLLEIVAVELEEAFLLRPLSIRVDQQRLVEIDRAGLGVRADVAESNLVRGAASTRQIRSGASVERLQPDVVPVVQYDSFTVRSPPGDTVRRLRPEAVVLPVGEVHRGGLREVHVSVVRDPIRPMVAVFPVEIVFTVRRKPERT